MMQRILFKHVDTIFKYYALQAGRGGRQLGSASNQSFVLWRLTIVFAGDYLQLLPVVPSRRQLEDEDGNMRYVPVSLLDEIPWRSML